MVYEEQAANLKRMKRLKEYNFLKYVWIPFYNEFYGVFLVTYCWSYFYIVPC